MNELALFAGAGGGILASRLLGWSTVGAVEIEKYPRDILLQRQRDGILEPFPVWDDVCTFDGKPWRGKIDVLSGGFPCQDISAAGKGAGLAGERSGLWREYARLIGEIRPEFVFAENSPLLRTRGLSVVLQDLTRLGHDVRWGVLGARDVGSNHKRNRMWVVAHTESECCGAGLCETKSQPDGGIVADCGSPLADSNSPRPQGRDEGVLPERTSELFVGPGGTPTTTEYSVPWQLEPDVGRVANGMAKRVDRIKAIGNGQVPAVAATAFRILSAGWL